MHCFHIDIRIRRFAVSNHGLPAAMGIMRCSLATDLARVAVDTKRNCCCNLRSGHATDIPLKLSSIARGIQIWKSRERRFGNSRGRQVCDSGAPEPLSRTHAALDAVPTKGGKVAAKISSANDG
jgi:hypothetical protein